ncbi:hypothetical protein TNCV_1071011 [Trichonephila clavipes]|nr:hypothetical protein TNCV_1071011 [Trichonephila clavipes]
MSRYSAIRGLWATDLASLNYRQVTRTTPELVLSSPQGPLTAWANWAQSLGYNGGPLLVLDSALIRPKFELFQRSNAISGCILKTNNNKKLGILDDLSISYM